MTTTTRVTATRVIGPKDFDPFRAQIRDCHCPLCRQTCYANRSDTQRRQDALNLLTALETGTHVFLSISDCAAQARAEHNARVAKACADGASDYEMWHMTRPAYNGREFERFYRLTSGQTTLAFRTGLGVGMTPGRYAEARKPVDDQVAAINRRLADAVPGLIEQDPRNVCACFRQTGALCDHHAPQFPASKATK